jgi:hypothetical protein
MIVATTPALLAHLVDSAATDADGGTRLSDAVDEHRRHLHAWYADLLGVLVVRASAATELTRVADIEQLPLAVVADSGLDRLGPAVAVLRRAGALVQRVESAVAKRGEDPVPGVARLVEVSAGIDDVTVHAEIPLTGGLLDALDVLAAGDGTPAGRWAATFRVGGLAGELFPAPNVLAGVICGCRDRGLRFTVNAGLRKALRHNDHETGFAHHGVFNVLAAALAAAGGAEQPAVADRLAIADPVPLVEAVRLVRHAPRPLWTAFSTTRIGDIVSDLLLFELMSADSTASDNPVS